jgi:4-hydroxythreonine-4-phosphate dehydrogenase
VNIAFVVLISWMVPRVSMIPVNISYFILLNLHFKISNKYTELMMKKSRKYNSWNFNRDLNGISEVVLKTFEDSRMLELCTPVIFANVKIMSFIKKNLESAVPLHGIDKLDQIVPGKINVLNLWKEGVDLNRVNDDVGQYAVKSFIAT